MLTTLLAFAGAAILLAMAPGPNTAVIFRQALRGGRPAAWAATAGIQCGLFFWAVATAFGLSALVAASQVAYDVLRVAGAVVLLGLGAQALWRACRRQHDETTPEPDTGPPAASAGRWRSAYTGFVTTLANPKAAVFAVSFLPQFVPAGAPVRSTLLMLAVVWVIVDGAWYVALSWALGRAKAMLATSRLRLHRWSEGISGAVLIGLGIRLALEQRR
jgi:threonine/homoserine/homoserine lactone efflux protein